MADAADFATEISEQHLQRSLAKHRAERVVSCSESGDCAECGEVINPARLAAIDTDLCADCASYLELKNV